MFVRLDRANRFRVALHPLYVVPALHNELSQLDLANTIVLVVTADTT